MVAPAGIETVTEAEGGVEASGLSRMRDGSELVMVTGVAVSSTFTPCGRPTLSGTKVSLPAERLLTASTGEITSRVTLSLPVEANPEGWETPIVVSPGPANSSRIECHQDRAVERSRRRIDQPRDFLGAEYPA